MSKSDTETFNQRNAESSTLCETESSDTISKKFCKFNPNKPCCGRCKECKCALLPNSDSMITDSSE